MLGANRVLQRLTPVALKWKESVLRKHNLQADKLRLLLVVGLLLLTTSVALAQSTSQVYLPLVAGGSEPPKLSAAEAQAGSPITSRIKDQIRPDIAYNNQAHEYLVVWEDKYSTSDHDIYGRRVSADGTAIGNEFSIANSVDNERNPSVTYNSTTNDYLVVWEHVAASEQHSVHAQRVSSTGSKISSELTVEPHCAFWANAECIPQVAHNVTDNEYLVIWADLTNAECCSVWGQRISASSTLSGSPVHLAYSKSLTDPAVIHNPVSNDYLVVWTGNSDSDVYAQVFDRWLAPLFTSKTIVSSASNYQIEPRIALNSQKNEYLVIWADHRRGEGSYSDIYGQLLDSSGQLRWNNFLISKTDAYQRLVPDVIYNQSGNEYMVSWEYQWTSSDHDVYIQRLDPSGSLEGSEVAISKLLTYEGHPVLATNGQKTYLIVWEDGRNSATQGIDLYADRAYVNVLSGHVYEGNVGDQSKLLAGITVGLYCAHSSSDLGTLQLSTTTNSTGLYEFILVWGWNCDFVNILETDPIGYESVNAVSAGGTVVSANRIRYLYPVRNVTLTGNDFWDKRQGPIDNQPPIFLPNFTPDGWVNTQTVNASVGVQDTFSGLAVSSAQYAYSKDSGNSWSSWQPASCTGANGTTEPQTLTAANVPFGQDSSTNGASRIKFRISDMATPGNPGESQVFSVAIDSIPPTNPISLWSPSHSPNVWSTDSTIDVAWTAVSDGSGSGLAGYRYGWSTGPENNPQLGTTNATSLSSSARGTSNNWYFNLRTVDNAYNQAVTTLHLGPFYVDTSIPDGCQISSPATVSDFSFLVQWSYQDMGSGVDRYFLQVRDGVDGQWRDWIDTTTTTATYSNASNLHTYFFRVRARDLAGNLSDYACQSQTTVHVPTCSDGVKNRDETGVDCGGTFCPPCSQCQTGGAKYAPNDTVCQNAWPTSDGPKIEINSESDSCNIIEVCDGDLDYIVEDALLCCEYRDWGNRLTGLNQQGKLHACSQAHNDAYPLGFTASFNPTSFKQCLAHYAINSFGGDAVYMQGYFDGELSCAGDQRGSCPKWDVRPTLAEMGTATSCAGPDNQPDYQMAGNRCVYRDFLFFNLPETGYWKSDTDWRKNNDSRSELPTHASIDRLSTGTCADYSLAITTVLRKIGYSKDEVFSVNGDRHEYNLVRFPGEAKWHYVDTVGNQDPEVFGGTFTDPTTNWYNYCTKLEDGCFNDVYGESRSRCPSNKMILGCENVKSAGLTAAAPWPTLVFTPPKDQLPVVVSSLDQVDEECTELHPCIREHTEELPPPGPSIVLAVNKQVSSEQITPRETLAITIDVQNLELQSVDVLVRETFIPGVAYDLTAQEGAYEGYHFQYHTWSLTIPAQSSSSITFKATPSTVGSYNFAPTLVTAGSSQYRATTPAVKVMCLSNNVCDAGENYLFCPADCQTGIQDDTCDMAADGKNDPDCTSGVDPDYSPSADTDGDHVVDQTDTCPLTSASEVVDISGCACSQKACNDENPLTVDICDPGTAACIQIADGDADGTPDTQDNCPAVANPEQLDSNHNGVGDQCELGVIAADTELDGATYFIDDSNDQGALRFAASNVVLDCKGSTINGTGTGFGIYVSKDVQHVTIKNCTIRNYRYGVYVDGSSGHQLLRNVLTANGYGIVLGFAANSEVISNTVDANEYAGIYVEDSSENQIRGNTTQSNGGMGIFLHTSMNNDVSSNQSCFNTYLDFDIYSSVSTGDNNTCDTPDIWNDAGAAGCTLACPKLLQQIYLPLVAR